MFTTLNYICITARDKFGCCWFCCYCWCWFFTSGGLSKAWRLTCFHVHCPWTSDELSNQDFVFVLYFRSLSLSCHKNIPRYKYTNHMIYMYIICIIWNVYFTINTFYLVICSIVPPILKYSSNPISEKTLAETRVFKSDKSGILSAQIPGSCVLNM